MYSDWKHETEFTIVVHVSRKKNPDKENNFMTEES